MTPETTHAAAWLRRCVRYARDLRRGARKGSALSPREQREFRRVSAEAMQDARYWRELVRGRTHAQAEAAAYA